MDLAFDEAVLAIGTSRPNPAVGAILVQGGEVVGRGRTQKPGSHHAEIMALRAAGDAARGADLYVTLEPCSHWGRTPPCADAIVQAGVGRVFISCLDANPKVNGTGVARIRSAGIPVEVGVQEERGIEFYRGFFHHLRTGLPWVDVKIAQTLDGYIAGPRGERTQISCPKANAWVHRLRARVDCITVGAGTALHDDPQLTVRGTQGNNPLRIVVSRHTQLPPHLKLFQDQEAESWVYSLSPQLALAGIEKRWPCEDFSIAWLSLLSELGSLGMHRVLFEAGSHMASLLLSDARLWDRFLLLTSPFFLGDGLRWGQGLPPNWKDSLRLSRFESIDCDFLAEFEHVYGNHTSTRNHP